MNGIEATRLIMLEKPHIKILGLSMYNDPSHAEAMREAGAVAFLDKGGPIGNLKAEIRRHAEWS
jgi:DNA-binding NarL/FixJ family response regulator